MRLYATFMDAACSLDPVQRPWSNEAMSLSFDLAEPYWTQPLMADQTFPSVIPSPPALEAPQDAIAADYEMTHHAEKSMPHMAAWNAGEISRLEMWMRRPSVFFVAAIKEIMDLDLSGGEFPVALVDAYQARNCVNVWPMLEEAGITNGQGSDRP
jgi:hypothetical protein